MPPTLARLADTAIDQCMVDNSLVNSASQTEPYKVARLVAHLPHYLVNQWSPYVKSGTLEVTSVFCHASPFVTYERVYGGSTQKFFPELGDLLLIIKSPHRGKMKEVGLLLQAKLGDSGEFTLKKTDWIQRYLYANWPDFTLKADYRKLPRPYQIGPSPVIPDTWTRYVSVEKSLSVKNSWRVEINAATLPPPSIADLSSMPAETFSAGSTLGDAIEAMSNHSFGRSTSRRSEWGLLVGYLKRIAYYKQMKLKKRPPQIKNVNPAVLPPHIVSSVAFLTTPWPLFRPSVLDLDDVNVTHRFDGLQITGSSRDPSGKDVPINIESPGFGIITIEMSSDLSFDLSKNVDIE